MKQHTERPNQCEAKKCKCSRGRNYESPDENHKYAFIYCHYCGSHSIHRHCNLGTIFLCEECSTVPHDRTEDEVIDITNQPAPLTFNSPRNIYSSHNGRRKENVMAIIELSDSDEDYVATYSETTVESKTVSVTRQIVCYPLRNCIVQIPRIDLTQLTNASTTKSSNDVIEFDVSDDSALAGDVSMENASQDGGDSNDSGNDNEVVAARKDSKRRFSFESDEETKSADEGERSLTPIRMNYLNNSDGFDVNDNSKKLLTSNMMSFSYKELKCETRSESSGIESISSFYISPEHRPKKVHRTSASSDGSIISTSLSSSGSSVGSSSSSASSSSSSSMSSSTKSTISIQSKETSDSEQSVKELESLANQLNSYAVKEEKVIKTELNDSSSSELSSSSPINKRKRHTLKDYFGNSSSSDDVIEVKPERKVAKRSSKSKSSRAPNQRSISDIFNKLNSSF